MVQKIPLFSGGPARTPSVPLQPASPVTLNRANNGFNNTLAPVHFSGGFAKIASGTINRVQKIFDQMDSSYLYSFLALDVVALWIARVAIGWTRGRDDYDPTTDSENIGKEPLQILGKTMWRDFKGLNHQNALEELLREMLTAPGCLGAPTLLYALATFQSRGKAFWLGQKDFNELKNAFIKHMDEQIGTKSGEITQSEYQKNIKQFLVGLFDDQAMLKTNVSINSTLSTKYGQASQKEISVGQFIEKWADKWSDNAVQSIDKTNRHTVDKTLNQLNDDLLEIIAHQYNRQHKTNEMLYESRKITTRLLETLKQPEKRSLTSLLSNLVNFKDYAMDAFTEHNQMNQSKFTEMAEFLARKVGRNKLLTIISGVGLGSLWLVLLPRFVQRGEHYPANRKDHRKESNQKTTIHQHTPSIQSHTTPTRLEQPIKAQSKPVKKETMAAQPTHPFNLTSYPPLPPQAQNVFLRNQQTRAPQPFYPVYPSRAYSPHPFYSNAPQNRSSHFAYPPFVSSPYLGEPS